MVCVDEIKSNRALVNSHFSGAGVSSLRFDNLHDVRTAGFFDLNGVGHRQAPVAVLA